MIVMIIQDTYSHFNGLEFLLIHKLASWQEIQELIGMADSKQSLDALFLRHDWSNQSDAGSRQITYLVKNRVAIESQNQLSISSEWYDRHHSSYVSDEIDVGIEILPTSILHELMSPGVAVDENEHSSILRRRWDARAVPLVLIGVYV